jgi:hypothetical protein
VIALLVALAVVLELSDKVSLSIGAPTPIVTPIGPGPAYRPPAGRPVAVCRTQPRFAVHLELFANRRAIVIPAGIGGCSDPARTRTPTGVAEIARGGLVLGDLFRIWGQPLAAHRLLSFRSSAPVRAYVNGRAVSGSVSSIPLRPGAEIVVEIGGYVPPHAFFLFPKGSS